MTFPAIKKLAATARDLLISPTVFFNSTETIKRAKYVPAWGFFSTALSIFFCGNGLFSYLIYWNQDPDAPLPAFSDLLGLGGTTVLFACAFCVVVLCCYWYLIVHKLAGARRRVPTSEPFKRLFHELLYLEGGLSCLAITGLVFLFPLGVAISGMFSGALFEVILEDLSPQETWEIALIFPNIVIGLVIVGPLLVLSLGYRVAFARAMFRLGRPRAFLAGLGACLAMGLALAPILMFFRLRADQLRFDEREVVEFLEAVSLMEFIHRLDNRRYADLPDLLTFLESKGELNATLGGYHAQWQLVRDTQLEDLSYRIVVQITDRGAYIHAIPKDESRPRGHFFLQEVFVPSVRVAEGRRAHLLDPTLLTFQ